MNTKVLNKISYGMYVIGTKYECRNVGCFVNTVTQITSQNPIISISVNKNNYTNEALENVRKFSVSILSENTNADVIGKFGFFSSRTEDKFKEFDFQEKDNLPILKEEVCGSMICEVIDIIDVETHNVFIARVLDAFDLDETLTPMTYKFYHEIIKGKAPKSAPTYIEEEIKMENNNEFKKYRCKICGYVYDEEKEGVKFEDLPEDWKCPLCKVGKNMFEEIK
mgnify:CR=1 FL=1